MGRDVAVGADDAADQVADLVGLELHRIVEPGLDVGLVHERSDGVGELFAVTDYGCVDFA
jgi:hypothetical protein